jgi:hypothetical protein
MLVDNLTRSVINSGFFMYIFKILNGSANRQLSINLTHNDSLSNYITKLFLQDLQTGSL